MLSKKRFIEGLIYIRDYYTTFNFDIKSETKVGVWYDVFKNYTDDTFTAIIKSYCRSNVYAPQSPTHLIQHVEQAIEKNTLTPDEAWEIGYGAIKSCEFDFRRVYNKLENYRAISISIKQMESTFKNLYTSDVPFRKRDFIELYKREIKRDTQERALLGVVMDKELLT